MVQPHLRLLISLILCALATIGSDEIDAEGRGRCSIATPHEFDISYSGEVDVVFKVQDTDSSNYRGDGGGGGGRGGGGGGGGGEGDLPLAYEIILDGAKVGGGMRCPSSFKLKGLAAGMHELVMVPEAEGGATGGSTAAAGQRGERRNQQQQQLPMPRRFWVAAESFRPGQRFSPPDESTSSSGRQKGKRSSGAEGGGGGGRDQSFTFWVVIPAYNAERWISSAIQSLRSQSHGGWRCIVIDDASSDATQAEAERAAGGDERFTISRNLARKGAARNFYEALEEGEGRRLGVQDEDVVVVLDGDDWLADANVLSHLANHVYSNSSCWVSYGSLVYFPMGIESTSPDFPHRVVASGSYREHEWISTHLRSAKYFIWKRIDESSFKGPEGDWLDMTVDMATMFPLLEMSAGRHCAVKQSMYVYNFANPINDFRVSEARQLELEEHIRTRKRYRPLLWW